MAILKVKNADGNIYDIPAIRGDKGENGATFTPSVNAQGI